MKTIRINTAGYQIRNETLDGVPHIVVPVVMIREGVHSGSAGAIYHSPEQLSRFTEAWNGIPVTIGHPQMNNAFVSANSPSILSQYGVGKIFNTYMEGDKLKGEAWIRVATIQNVSQATLDLIHSNAEIDVSVGVFSEDIQEAGTWNGEAYTSIATNYRPDHLAILPYEQGACSYNDGCGIRSNSKTDINEMDLKQFKAEALKQEPLQVNADMVKRVEDIRSLVDSKDVYEGPNRAVHYVEEIEDNYFIYKVRGEENQQGYFKQMYSVNADDQIELQGEPVEVKKDVSYQPLQNNVLVRTKPVKKDNKVEPIKTNQMDKEKRVQDLISVSCFCEQDTEYLMAQPDEKLTAFEEAAKKEPTVVEKVVEKVVPATYATTDEFIAAMPAEMQDSMKNGLRLHNEQRTATIAKIQANAKDVWPEDELKAMSNDMLEKIASTIPSKVDENGMDYTALGAGATVQTNAEVADIMLPTGMGVEKK